MNGSSAARTASDDFWSALVAVSHDVPALLRLIADRVVDALGDGCVVTTLDDAGERLVPQVVRHVDPVVAAAMEAVLAQEPMQLGEGLAGSAAADRRSIMLNDLPPATVAETIPARFLPFVRDHPMRAIAIVPLVAAGELLGTLGSIRTTDGDPYTEDDLRLLEGLAHQASLAMADALTGPRSIGVADYEAIFHHNIDGVIFSTPDGHMLAANPAACAMLGRSQREIIDSAREDLVEGDDPRLARALEERAATGRVRTELTMLRADGSTFPAAVSSTIYTAQHGQVRTVIIFRDISVEVAARHAAAARLDELAQAADRDPLTGLWNRRGFAVAGTHALAEADRHGLVSQVVFIDLDGLKSINDELGHAAGDTAIRAVASAIERALRDVDVACRFGGDEFVFLAVGTPAGAVPALARRIEEHLTRAALPVPLTFTVGAVERSPHGETDLDELIDAADRDMYQHKVLRRLRGQQGGAAHPPQGQPRGST
ncbi:MAG TPA: diguanylate cyclase [Acidimicrobiales bacterium]|nr:diguanylate cyclase [Acidimicrobiales bacterium]